MKNTEEITQTVDVVTSITCDDCGNRIYNHQYEEWQEILSIRFTGGYASIFGDMVTMEVQLCQHCVKKRLGDVLRASEENF